MSGIAPGVYLEVSPTQAQPGLRTGVPAVLGLGTGWQAPRWLPSWLEAKVALQTGSQAALFCAVRGFFENGGQGCWVVPLDGGFVPAKAQLAQRLAALLDDVEDIDLVCAPIGDLPGSSDADWLPALQAALITYCARRGSCFAILDPLPESRPRPSAIEHAATLQRTVADQSFAGLYYPRLQVAGGCKACWQVTPPSPTCPSCAGTQRGFIPPSGHIAGMFSRIDQQVGFYRAPANQVLAGVVGLEPLASPATPANLNAAGVNSVRALPGRGIRVMGARTLRRDSAFAYVNVRRLFIGVTRWLQQGIPRLMFETNDLGLWARVTRHLEGFLTELYRRGALQGTSAEAAFFVRCDAELNPVEVRKAGRLIVQLGLAPLLPSEFITIRLVHGPETGTVLETI